MPEVLLNTAPRSLHCSQLLGSNPVEGDATLNPSTVFCVGLLLRMLTHIRLTPATVDLRSYEASVNPADLPAGVFGAHNPKPYCISQDHEDTTSSRHNREHSRVSRAAFVVVRPRAARARVPYSDCSRPPCPVRSFASTSSTITCTVTCMVTRTVPVRKSTRCQPPPVVVDRPIHLIASVECRSAWSRDDAHVPLWQLTTWRQLERPFCIIRIFSRS